MAEHWEISEDVVYHLRDKNPELVDSWREMFADYADNVKISQGDIFQGAPAVDALVSPANSFGFMDGGIDYVYTKHFGVQMQNRLQKVIQNKHNGELLVGNAVVIPSYGPEGRDKSAKDWSKYNDGVPIKYLISAPTMRIPLNVANTPNAYLAFRAVLLAVRKHNSKPNVEPIRSVLVPGLGTAVGRMPKNRCAFQMLQAYETCVLNKHPTRIEPVCLEEMYLDHEKLCEFSGNK
uniref:Macro domain-containing protein n=1 Tax=Arion vulgaris TaxID=1028688 RepID=A0A0B7AR58_9EUPU